MNCNRGPMVRDLVHNVLVRGESTPGHVQDLLGSPDEWSPKQREKPPEMYGYRLGTCGYLGFDHVLDIYFDASGKLASFDWFDN